MSFQLVGRLVGAPIIDPDVTPVRVAPASLAVVNVVFARFVFTSLALVRFALGPMR